MDEGLTLNFPAVGSMARSACIRRLLAFSPSLAKSTRAASTVPVRVLFFAALMVLWACLADGCPAQVTCRVHWECPAGSTGIAGCEGLMHGMSGDGTPVEYASSSQCQSAIANLQDGLRRTCNCGPDTSSDVTASNGFELKSTGSATGDLVNDAAQLWILQNIKNPYTMTFAQNFTQSFLTSYIQGQKQREAIEASIRAQQEQQAELAREAEQRRVDAIFARLNSELKLSGIDSQLALKTGGDPTQLAMKLSGSGSDALAFKIGGAPPSPAAEPPEPANVVGGLKLKLGDEPSSGATPPPETTSTTSTNATPAMGIPGLPGIYLNDVPPAKSPEVAVAALSMDGQERDIAEDAALQAAQKNLALTAPSDDPMIQDYQQQSRVYADALKAQQAALDKAAEAEGHVQADQTALNYANELAQTSGATEPQSQAMARLQAVVGEEEDMAAAAQVGFDKAGAEASIKREEAAISLASLAPPGTPTQPGQVSLSSAGPDGPIRDAVSGSQVTQPSGSTTFFGSAGAKPSVSTASQGGPAPAPQTGTPEPVGSGLPVLNPTSKPQMFPPQQTSGKSAFAWESVEQCLAQTTSPAHPNPSLDELRQQLKDANRAYDQLLKSMAEQSAEWKYWNEKWQQDGRDTLLHAFDDTIDHQLEGAVETAKEPLEAEEAAVKKELGELAGEYRDYHSAMAGTSGMMGIGSQGAVVLTPNRVQQMQMIGTAEYKARLIPLNGQRLALSSQLVELDEQMKRADLLLSRIRLARGKVLKAIDDYGEPKAPDEASKSGTGYHVPTMEETEDWLSKDETTEKLHEFLETSFALAKYTGVGVPIAEGGELALEALDLGFDAWEAREAFDRMKQSNLNDAKFEQARLSLQRRINRLRAEASCYSQAGASATAEVVQ